MKHFIFMLVGVVLFSCGRDSAPQIQFHVIDTDFSKGRLTFEQKIDLDDLVKFHGHLCDGLVVGAQAMQVVLDELYPTSPIDRTNLRIVSKPSPCLTDVAVYLTGGRYQFNTFYVDESIEGLFVVQRLDDLTAFSVELKRGIKPAEIDSLGVLAVQQVLAPCMIDTLRQLEDAFTDYLLSHSPEKNFSWKELTEFTWSPRLRSDFIKTDVVNKSLQSCGE